MSNHWFIGLIGFIGSIGLGLITTASARCTAHRVATMLASADKICNAMIIYYLAAGLKDSFTAKNKCSNNKNIAAQASSSNSP
jgi:hypothetical protein